tara:strand:- start:123 stop:464 length:342 start_codon:yes stop_codon:yes gene_type:complete
MLRVSSGSSNDGANLDATFLNPCQRLFEVICFLAGLEINKASVCSETFQNFGLYAIHVADDRLRTNASIEAFDQGAITGQHHVRSLNQSHDDIILSPFSSGKNDTCLTWHTDG